jgi:NhaA family Na+:H+ antiporter
MALLLASLTAGTVGFLWLKLLGKPEGSDEDMDTMDFESDGEAPAENLWLL